jgi:two-component system response regulator AtoC
MALLNPNNRPFIATSTSFAGVFFGRTSGMQQIRRDLELLSQTDLPVLLHGESGTGKGFVAELLHRQSRTSGWLLKVDCVMEQSVSSLLSEAVDVESKRSGWSQLIQDGGTLLLDGIEDMKLEAQAVLLLLLKRTKVAASGGIAPVRVVSTCSSDLLGLTEKGRFRPDLLYHINTVKIALPPLRQRPEDIRGIADYYLDRYARDSFRPRPYLSAEAQTQLERYVWPGNIRQLDNLMRNMINVGSEEAALQELSVHPETDQFDLSQPIALKEITRKITHEVERQIIVKVLRANGWNRQKTAKWLKMSYRSLLYKLNELSLEGDSNVRPMILRKSHPTGQ